MFCQKIDFHQFMTSWRCEYCWFYQKMCFFAPFDPFNPNIWNINPAHFVANFLKIILKKSFLIKIDFHQFMTSWRCEYCWFYQKMRCFFALFDPFNPNIWKIYPTYLVANFLNIILKFFFAKKSIFTNLWHHEGVNFAEFT